jgi:hypothetical protein
METQLTFIYDRDGDIFYINKVKPYKEQESEEVEEGIIARFHPVTDEIENLEILFFSKRLGDNSFELPISLVAHAQSKAIDLRLATRL